jgi:predicted transcriptional regulator
MRQKAGAMLQAIGEVLGVTRQRVRQILNRQRLREGGELSFKVVRLKKAGQELLARAGNIMVARAAFDVSVSLYQSAEIELRQGSVGLHQRP